MDTPHRLLGTISLSTEDAQSGTAVAALATPSGPSRAARLRRPRSEEHSSNNNNPKHPDPLPLMLLTVEAHSHTCDALDPQIKSVIHIHTVKQSARSVYIISNGHLTHRQSSNKQNCRVWVRIGTITIFLPSSVHNIYHRHIQIRLLIRQFCPSDCVHQSGIQLYKHQTAPGHPCRADAHQRTALFHRHLSARPSSQSSPCGHVCVHLSPDEA